MSRLLGPLPQVILNPVGIDSVAPRMFNRLHAREDFFLEQTNPLIQRVKSVYETLASYSIAVQVESKK